MSADFPQDAIELRVDRIAQLFHSLDPYPFRERDLDKDAEDYIVGWARELPADQPIAIVVHVPDSEAQSKAAKELREAFPRYFSYRADSLQRELNELFRVGRRSLAIGIVVLAACLLSAHYLAGYFFAPPFKRLVEESLLILGWVANWRPIEIFIYDWWPIVRRRNFYRRLAAATVEVRPYPAKL
jgi:ABC-type spermidine/putrescine transport system permease subunit I